MMGLTWYLLGLATTGSVIFMWKFSHRHALNWQAWSGFGFGIVLILFSVAWGVGAVLEGVPRAGSMGILLFGLPGIILLTITLRYSTQRLRKIHIPAKNQGEAASRKVPAVTLKTVQSIPTEKSRWALSLRYGAYVSLFIAFIVGYTTNEKDYESLIMAKYSHLDLQKIKDNPVVFQVGEKENGKGEYILIQEGQGYGGPFIFGIRIKDDGKVHEVIPLDDKETPAFLKKIKESNYKEQFIGRGVADNFIVGDDIDAVSGATVTTMAATEAIGKGAHIAAAEYFKLPQTWENTPWKFGLGEVLIIIIFICAFIPQIHRKPFRYAYMAGSIGVVGFYLNGAISIGNLSGLLMGYIPSISSHLIWWVLVVGSLASIMLLGKNIYCYKICPFYGVQYLLNKISGNSFKLSPAITTYAKWMPGILLWLSLMIIFLSRHPSAGAFEPFAMMFSLEGVGIQWYILPLSIIGSFFVSNFWCRFFCPVGSAFSKVLKLRTSIVRTIFSKNRSEVK